jgi:hypothetical protein
VPRSSPGPPAVNPKLNQRLGVPRHRSAGESSVTYSGSTADAYPPTRSVTVTVPVPT